MNQLFVHWPLFRLLSPLFNGTVVYLLILLINNNVMALEQQFLGQELYFCIGLAYMIQESSRFSILLLSKSGKLSASFWGILIPALISSIVTVVIVSGSMYWYFEWILGFSPIMSELSIFNSIFLVMTWLYLVLFISHDLLKKTHETYLRQEEELKTNVQRDFVDFKQGVNPELLFESLEQLILLSRQDVDQAEAFLDELALVYRYVLSRKQELVDVNAELEALNHFIQLLNNLPNRQLTMQTQISGEFVVVPGVLLKSVELILRSAIVNYSNPITIIVTETEHFMQVESNFFKRLTPTNQFLEIYEQLKSTYSLYTDLELIMDRNPTGYAISIPKLNLAQ